MIIGEEKKQIDLDILPKFALHSCTMSRVNSSCLEKNVWFVWLPILMISWISLKCLGLRCILTRTYCLLQCCNNKSEVPVWISQAALPSPESRNGWRCQSYHKSAQPCRLYRQHCHCKLWQGTSNAASSKTCARLW